MCTWPKDDGKFWSFLNILNLVNLVHGSFIYFILLSNRHSFQNKPIIMDIHRDPIKTPMAWNYMQLFCLFFYEKIYKLRHEMRVRGVPNNENKIHDSQTKIKICATPSHRKINVLKLFCRINVVTNILWRGCNYKKCKYL